MKYLKKFNEEWSWIDNLIKDAEDICIELNHIHIQTSCYYINDKSFGKYIRIDIGKEWYEFDDVNYEDNYNLIDVEDVVNRLIYFFESNDCRLKGIEIDGGSYNREFFIKEHNKLISEFKFSLLSIRFSPPVMDYTFLKNKF